MRILYVALAYDYGRPENGPSFEEMNFRSALEGMGHDVVPYDFKTREGEIGRKAMNRELVQLAGDTRPDLAFLVLFENEIEPATISAVGAAGGAPTVNWFADDHWRFDHFSRRYAKALDWVVTTDRSALAKYAAAGQPNTILSQWACNRYAYRHTTTSLRYDVTFVGQPHSDRRAVVDRIRAAGFDVQCWGWGWPAGRVNHEEMVDIFGSSRVNLNLGNSSRIEGIVPRVLAIARGMSLKPRPSQIKGRTFEVPGSGGFLLTDRVPHLQDYLTPGREIAVFDTTDDMIEQIGYWLEHDDERAAVARAGYERVLGEHTYDHRFAAIFREMGLA